MTATQKRLCTKKNQNMLRKGERERERERERELVVSTCNSIRSLKEDCDMFV